MPFHPKILAVIDTETTGLDAHRHTVLQYGMVRLFAGSLEYAGASRTNVRISTQDWQHADPEALAVNGITHEDTEDAPTREQALDYMFSRNTPWSATQAAFWPPEFDLVFIKAEYARAGRECPMPRRVLDVRSVCYAYDMAASFGKPHAAYGLQEWMAAHEDLKRFDIPLDIPGHEHDALYDAFVTANALRRAVLALRELRFPPFRRPSTVEVSS
jgi:DNA polymerase III epsilon subunit-like protein